MSRPINNTNDQDQVHSDQTEFIIIPDKDVMDELPMEESANNAPRLMPQDMMSKIAPTSENIYGFSRYDKGFNASTWFITSLLMTLVILGGVFSYFTVEDQRTQIAGLEKQTGQVAGIREANRTDDSNVTENTDKPPEAPETGENLQKPVASGENLSIFVEPELKAKFNFSEKQAQVIYFGNRTVTVSSYLSYQNNAGQQFKDGVDIYSLEKDASINKDTILSSLKKEDPGYKFDGATFKTKNNISLESISSSKTSKIKYLVSETNSYTYLIAVYNQSFGQANQSVLNNYLANIPAKISLN